MILTFEDKNTSIISELMLRVYSEHTDIEFSGGNRSLQDVLDVINQNETYIIYVDVVPDNRNTVELYKKLQEVVRVNKMDNVYLMPIPCIEYYVIKAFCESEDVDIQNVLKRRAYKDSEFVKITLKGVCNSFEVYCKKVLGHKPDVCKRIKKKTIRSGKFYSTDCICQDSYSKCITSMTLDEKATKLIVNLPVHKRLGRYYEDKVCEINLEKVQGWLTDDFNKFSEELYTAGCTTEYYKLDKR